MRLHIAGLFGALSLLAACSSTTPVTSDEVATGATGQDVMAMETDFVQHVGDKVFFAFDKSDLVAESQETLKRQADWLKSHPGATALVEGYADERGGRDYNLALGARRAEAARAFLISLGIDGNRLETVSFGKERPFVLGSTEEAYAQNRVARSVIK